jgi:predicted deacylase
MSRISSTIAFDSPGKQTGFLRLPYSSHESAYGWIPIPIVCIVGGTGPTVLLVGGNHGDEYEGQVALAALCRTLDPSALRGRVIIVPSANFPAAMAGRRISPIDGGNLNRSFPGSEGGSPTEMIAHFIETKLLPMSDCAIDVHSGGSSLQYCPTIRARSNSDAQITERTLTLLRAFGAPYGCIYKPLAGESRTMAAAAARCDVPYLCI